MPAARRGKLLLVAVPVLAATLLLIWPEWMLRQRDPTGPLYLAQSLFSIHADLINDQMAEDLARLTPTPVLAAVSGRYARGPDRSAAREPRRGR